ncbi:MAG: hypothetical protein PHP83_03305, partial [Clostridia bacterium]|nr:hypothetical protein [Clostridia bacterium]
NTSGSLYSTILPIVNSTGPQIVTYRLILPSYTGTSDLKYYFCVYVSNENLLSLKNDNVKTYSIGSADVAPYYWDLFGGYGLFVLNDIDGDGEGTPADYLSNLWANVTIKSGINTQSGCLTIESGTGTLLLKLNNTDEKFINEIVFDLSFTNGVNGNVIKTFTNIKIAPSAVLTPENTYSLVQLGYVTSELGDLANQSVIAITTSEVSSLTIGEYVQNAGSIKSIPSLLKSLKRYTNDDYVDEIYQITVVSGTSGKLYNLEANFYVLKTLVPTFIIEKEYLYRGIRYMNPNFEGITVTDGVPSGDNASLSMDICNEFTIKNETGSIVPGEKPYISDNSTVLYTYNVDETSYPAVSIIKVDTTFLIKVDTTFLYKWAIGDVFSSVSTISFDIDVSYKFSEYTVINTMTIIVNRPDTYPIS